MEGCGMREKGREGGKRGGMWGEGRVRERGREGGVRVRGEGEREGGKDDGVRVHLRTCT